MSAASRKSKRKQLPYDIIDAVLGRANRRCEYCRAPVRGKGAAEIEHVIPVIICELNQDFLENLACACRTCNKRKAAHVEYQDPWTGKIEKIFNPRQSNPDQQFDDYWAQHFDDAIPPFIFGKTPIGRATAHLLFKPHEPDYPWEQLKLRRVPARFEEYLTTKFGRLKNSPKTFKPIYPQQWKEEKHTDHYMFRDYMKLSDVDAAQVEFHCQNLNVQWQFHQSYVPESLAAFLQAARNLERIARRLEELRRNWSIWPSTAHEFALVSLCYQIHWSQAANIPQISEYYPQSLFRRNASEHFMRYTELYAVDNVRGLSQHHFDLMRARAKALGSNPSDHDNLANNGFFLELIERELPPLHSYQHGHVILGYALDVINGSRKMRKEFESPLQRGSDIIMRLYGQGYENDTLLPLRRRLVELRHLEAQQASHDEILIELEAIESFGHKLRMFNEVRAARLLRSKITGCRYDAFRIGLRHRSNNSNRVAGDDGDDDNDDPVLG